MSDRTERRVGLRTSIPLSTPDRRRRERGHLFVRGTRAVVADLHEPGWVVVCATCGVGWLATFGQREHATAACVRLSTHPCQSCGAT